MRFERLSVPCCVGVIHAVAAGIPRKLILLNSRTLICLNDSGEFS